MNNKTQNLSLWGILTLQRPGPDFPYSFPALKHKPTQLVHLQSLPCSPFQPALEPGWETPLAHASSCLRACYFLKGCLAQGLPFFTGSFKLPKSIFSWIRLKTLRWVTSPTVFSLGPIQEFWGLHWQSSQHHLILKDFLPAKGKMNETVKVKASLCRRNFSPQ